MAIVVLGMHRSGTSAVTRVINLLGASAPDPADLMPATENNPTGHWESVSLTAFNDDLLLTLGGTWTAPPELPDGWIRDPRLAPLREPARHAFTKIYPDEPWVWKDPRNCVLLPFWVDLLAVRPAIVLVTRNPLEICRSLESRDHLPRPLALALWERNLRGALSAARDLPVMVTRYADWLAGPERCAAETISFLDAHGVPTAGDFPGEEITRFLDRGLRHAEHTAADFLSHPHVSPAQRELFEAVESLRGPYRAFAPPTLSPETPSTGWLLSERREADLVRLSLANKEIQLRRETEETGRCERATRDAYAEIDRLRKEHVETRGHAEDFRGRLSLVEADRDRWQEHARRAQQLLDEIRASRGWQAIEAARGLRRKLAGSGRDLSSPAPHDPTPRASSPASDRSGEVAGGACAPTFEELPWRFTGSRAPGPAGRIQILMTSHDATRTGAPLALRGLLAELSARPELECWVLLNTRGPLEDEFARLAPTLVLDAVTLRAGGRQAALDTIASSFQRHAARGLALCNTITTPDLNTTLARHGVAVVSWIHELPTSIDASYGGEATFRAIRDASRSVMVPSRFVREALIRRYGEKDAEKLRVLVNGIEAPPGDLPRGATRRAVREELGIPHDAVVILGCGTIDQRKGADLFVQIAARLRTEKKAWFVWVGNPLDSRVLAWGLHDAEALGVGDRVFFIGERDSVAPYLLAADLFALTSREDPFPLVNLEAMAAGLPVVAFQDGGGAPEVLDDGAGIVVPYMDLDRFGDAISRLVRDESARHEMGNRAAARIHGRAFTWTRFADDFRSLLERDLRLLPPRPLTVSAVVVCYDHERYLKERLESVLGQTRPPDEIVFVDDASQDSSVAIAQEIAGRSPVPFRFVLNEKNSGSPFVQWTRGIEAASGDLVWIAEGDDFCAPQLLETLVAAFFDPEVVLAYAQSAPVGEDGRLHEPDYRGYTADLSATRWNGAYVNEGAAEIRDCLAVKNTIPSASAVVLRRPGKGSLPEDLREFRFAGDWRLYAHLLEHGKIAFVPKVLNFHRRHAETVTSSIELDDRAIVEQLRVKASIFERAPVPANTMAASIAQTISEYYRLGELHGLERPAFMDNPELQPWIDRLRVHFDSALPANGSGSTLLLAIGDAEIGGGQIAAIRLANELSARHRVFLCNARPELFDEAVAAMVGPNLTLLEGTLGRTEWAAASQAADSGNGLCEGPRRIAVVRDLLRFHRVDRLMSQIWWADRFLLEVHRDLRLPWFIQMHGCYEGLVEHPDWDPAFPGLAREILGRVSGVCYSSAKNLGVFEALPAPRPRRLQQFYNGLDPETVPARAEAPDVARGRDEFLFCLCSRAIPEKGWEEAIAATLRINSLAPEQRAGKRARLLLIGDSEYARSLRARFDRYREIRFLGLHRDPLPLIRACDVGLLPSRFVSESVPSTVIEYLACGKPVVATDIGSIPDMIVWGQLEAGVLIGHEGGSEAITEALGEAMLRYMTVPELLQAHRRNAPAVFDARFNLKRLAREYEAFFEGSSPGPDARP